MMMMITVSHKIVILLWGIMAIVSTTAASTTKSSDKKSSSSSNKVKRLNHLDYLDVETMNYYLQAPKLEYDVAILFYAQWCKNCHALAPMWDQISRILQAGTKESQLIMGLFDCEASVQHAELCTDRFGITHYPTMVYMSMAGNSLQARSKKKHPHMPTHMTTFPGNWQYGDAILDWLTVLSKLSHWHRKDYGSRIRQWILGSSSSSSRKNKKNKQQQQQQQQDSLPIGIPSDVQNQQEIVRLQQLQTDTQNLAVRSSIFVDCLLLPKSAPEYLLSSSTNNNKENEDLKITMSDHGGKNYTDVYALLQHRKAWQVSSSTTTTDLVLRTCASEVSLDYCTRLSEQYADTWLEQRLGSSKLSSLDITEAEYVQFSDQLHAYLNETEPFCSVMDECVAMNFEDANKCQPAHCPFQDPVACRYLTACLTESIQIEYAEAMQLLLDTPSSTSKKSASSTKTETNTDRNQSKKEQTPGGGKKKTSAWGF